MLIIAKILTNYCVNQYLIRVNRFPDLKYVHLEVTIKYIADIRLKRLIIGKNSGPHFEIQTGGHLV